MTTAAEGTNPGETIIVRGNTAGRRPHAITIVGYDDNVCVDVNGDGEIEPAEKGAFKLANSWGDEWENNGYIWLLYDACNNVSRNSSSTWQNIYDAPRLGFINLHKCYYIDVEARNALLLGVVDMATVDRYQARVLYSAEDENGNVAYDQYCLMPKNNTPILPFYGSFVFCIDSALRQMPGVPGRPETPYFSVNIGTDNLGPYEMTVNSVKIIDDKGRIIASDTDSRTVIDIYNVDQNAFDRDTTFSIKLIFGDLNTDGKVQVSDSALLKMILTGSYAPSTLQKLLADVDRDGKITSNDNALIKRMILGTY